MAFVLREKHARENSGHENSENERSHRDSSSPLEGCPGLFSFYAPRPSVVQTRAVRKLQPRQDLVQTPCAGILRFPLRDGAGIDSFTIQASPMGTLRTPDRGGESGGIRPI